MKFRKLWSPRMRTLSIKSPQNFRYGWWLCLYMKQSSLRGPPLSKTIFHCNFRWSTQRLDCTISYMYQNTVLSSPLPARFCFVHVTFGHKHLVANIGRSLTRLGSGRPLASIEYYGTLNCTSIYPLIAEFVIERLLHIRLLTSPDGLFTKLL